MLREDKSKQADKGCTIIKITSFVNHKPKDTIIKSTNIIEELKSKEKPSDPGPEEGKHEDNDSQKEMSGGEEQGEAEQEEMVEQEEMRDDSINTGEYIYLKDQGKYACIKSVIDEGLYECDVKQQGKEEDIQMLTLLPLKQ